MRSIQNSANLPTVFTSFANLDNQSTQGSPTKLVMDIKLKQQSLQCKFCQYVGPRLIRLQQHVKTKHEGLRHKCTECSYQCTESSNLNRHIDKIHRGIRHTCEHCSRDFTEKRLMKTQMENIHSSNDSRKKIYCGECTKEYFTKSALLKHEKSTHMGIIHSCIKCDYKGSSKDRLNYHIEGNHNIQEILKCGDCPYTIKSKKSLRVHIESKHSATTLKCHQCPYSSPRSEYLRKHIKTQHSGVQVQCEQCDFSTNSNENLRYHIQNKHLDEKHFCSQCEYVSNTKGKLRDHVVYYHEERTTYSCDQCSHVSRDKRNMKIHKLNKHEGMVWPCKMCTFKAAAPASLREHTKVVHFFNHQIKHKCEYCNQTFVKRFHLKLHIRIHTGERPHACEFCFKTFIRGKQVEHRLGLCVQQQPLVCPYCQSSFTKYKNMKIHIIKYCKKYSRTVLPLVKASNQDELFDIHQSVPNDGHDNTEIVILKDNLAKDESSLIFKDFHKEETNMKNYEDTIYPYFEGNMNDTAIHSNTKHYGIPNCDKCDYSSHNLHFNRLHKLSHHFNGLKLFKRLPKYLRNRKFTSKGEFKKELENYLDFKGLYHLSMT